MPKIEKQLTEEEEPEIKKKKPHPQERAGVLSYIFLTWTFPLFWKGFKKDLTIEDLCGPLQSQQSAILGDVLEAAWMKEVITRAKPSFWRVLIKVYGKDMLIYGFILLFQEIVIKMSQPIFIGKLISYYDPGQTDISLQMAYLYACGILAATFLNSIILNLYFLGLQSIGIKVRISVCSLVYRKALRLNSTSMAQTTVGQMVNLITNDVSRFEFLVMVTHYIFVVPLQVAMALFLLNDVHPSAMVGIGLLVLFIPVQWYIGKKTSYFRFKTAVRTDTRVRLMNEIIQGIQVIKMYTWEKPFAKLVEVARLNELNQIKASSYLRAVNGSFMIFLNRTSIYLCILTYILTGNTLNAGYVYVISSLYGMLRTAVTILLPRAISLFAETNVSIKRFEKFLLYEEINLEEEKPATNGSISLNELTKKEPKIDLDGVCVKWDKRSAENTLSDINFHVAPGQLVAIVGPVGAGKSTLLHVLIKELDVLKGEREVVGKISYASQEPWLFVGSIRENILFGEEFDSEKYQQVVKACALERDFTLFPYGDRTIVGERGVMLSGGQKARINLARAVYKDADIYLLDDPLSAVDTHVGKQLFNDCITGYLKNKTTVLITHQLQYLGHVEAIYLIENGSITVNGTYNELQNSGGEFVKLLENQEDEAEDEEKKKEEAAIIKTQSVQNLLKDTTKSPVQEKEQISSGTMSSKIYTNYIKSGGGYCSLFILLIMFIGCQAVASFGELFLNRWVNLEQTKMEKALKANVTATIVTTERGVTGSLIGSTLISIITNTTNSILEETEVVPWYEDSMILFYIYSGFIVMLITLALSRSLNFFKFCMRASKYLHNNMFGNLVYTSMRFFNTNPSGRILNRFSKDVGSIDETLPVAMLETFQIMLSVLGVVIVLMTINVWILLPTLVIFAIFYGYKIIFLATSRNLKRIDGTTRSPIYSHLTASIQGISTIRAFGTESTLRKQFDDYQDTNTGAYYLFCCCSRTFALWLDLNCLAYISLVILSFLFMGNETYGANVGLAITQSITLTTMLQHGMRQWSDLENQMTSVERVVEYTDLDPEPNHGKSRPPKFWPSQGSLQFIDLSMQYKLEDAFVLKKLCFEVEAGEKVGIVGRTGAGKSSLISALFRLTHIEGTILIDGVNTQEISLKELRSKISIIPQEPILFSGPLRKNLDPFEEYNDEILWNALDEVKLKTVIADLPTGLLTNVTEGGSNFSVGERQLLCLARAVVRSNKILLMDEATANVDPQTDELIQNTIRKKFKDCTVLTIAHRLNTVMDSDKILVMDAGKAAQFGHPHELLEDHDGIFYGLVHQTGPSMAEHLTEIARKNHVGSQNATSN